MLKWATISPCGKYRFDLGRPAESRGAGLVVMCLCNPSTADADRTDPTLTRGVGFATSWQFQRLVYVNTNPYRSTDPDSQEIPPQEVLRLNDRYLEGWAGEASMVVAAWGTKAIPALAKRAETILRGIGPLYAIKLTKDGIPGHPLYLPSAAQPFPF